MERYSGFKVLATDSLLRPVRVPRNPSMLRTPRGIRTHNPLIKSQMLCQLS